MHIVSMHTIRRINIYIYIYVYIYIYIYPIGQCLAKMAE